jgi:PAS domain-containing protein
LIAKIDQAEAYRPIRNEAAQIALLVGLLLLAVVLTGVSLWRRRYADTLHRALAAEQGHQAMAERLGLVMRHANDSIMIMEADGRIREANECALATYGYTIAELRALPPGGLRPTATADQLDGQMAAFATDAGTVFETPQGWHGLSGGSQRAPGHDRRPAAPAGHLSRHHEAPAAGG